MVTESESERPSAASTASAKRPWEDEAELAQLIGLVVVRWGHIEGYSYRIAWDLWDWDVPEGRTITVGMNILTLWDLIEAGIKRREHRMGVLSRFEAWRASAELVRRSRNDAVHSLWMTQYPDFNISATDDVSRKALKAGETRLPFGDWRAELDDIAERASTCAGQLFGIINQLLDADRWFKEGIMDHATEC